MSLNSKEFEIFQKMTTARKIPDGFNVALAQQNALDNVIDVEYHKKLATAVGTYYYFAQVGTPHF